MKKKPAKNKYIVKIDTPWVPKGTVYEVTEGWGAQWHPIDYPDVFNEIIENEKANSEKETSKEEVQWQKIETCPRDGSFILLTDGKEVYQGNFSEKGFWKGTNISRTKLGFGLYPNLPTHWMPLPAPPKED